MTETNCGECALYRTEDCRPDKCLPGYRMWTDPMGDVWGRCECGGKLIQLWTRPYSRTAKQARYICVECGAKWRETISRKKEKEKESA